MDRRTLYVALAALLFGGRGLVLVGSVALGSMILAAVGHTGGWLDPALPDNRGWATWIPAILAAANASLTVALSIYYLLERMSGAVERLQHRLDDVESAKVGVLEAQLQIGESAGTSAGVTVRVKTPALAADASAVSATT